MKRTIYLVHKQIKFKFRQRNKKLQENRVKNLVLPSRNYYSQINKNKFKKKILLPRLLEATNIQKKQDFQK